MVKNTQLTKNKRNFIVILKAGMIHNIEILNALHVQLEKMRMFTLLLSSIVLEDLSSIVRQRK